MRKYVPAVISFVFVFAGVFFVAGMFLMPLLPPVPDKPVSFFEGRYWVDNWIGILLGLVLGILSARSVLSKGRRNDASRAEAETSRSPTP